MQSTLTPQETDPHDVFVLQPDAVVATRADSADRASPNRAHDAMSPPLDRQTRMISDVFASASTPTVDTTFRAADVDNIKVPRDRSAALIGFLFALCSAVGVAAWTHYGDAAKQMISNWTPSFVLTSPFALTSSPPAEKPPLADQPGSSPVQAAAADQAPAQPALAAQPSEAAAPAVAPSSPDQAQLLRSMSRDLATMGQQIQQLNASIEQLKAGQAQMSRDIARTSEAKTSEAKTSEAKTTQAKPSEIRTPEQSPRARVSALPPRPLAAPVRRPRPAYPAAQPAIVSTLPPPQAVAPLMPPQPEPQAQITAPPDADPVVRPPMPLR